MYSVLCHNEFYFSACANSNVKMFVLDRSFLINSESKIDLLNDALDFGRNIIREDGVPI